MITKTDRFTPLSRSLQFNVLSYLTIRNISLILTKINTHFRSTANNFLNGEFNSHFDRFQTRNVTQLLCSGDFERYRYLSRRLHEMPDTHRLTAIIVGIFQRPCLNLRQLFLPARSVEGTPYNISDGTLDAIAAGCPNLTSLTCEKVAITDAGVNSLIARCRQLVAFNLVEVRGLTYKSIVGLEGRALTKAYLNTRMIVAVVAGETLINDKCLSNTQCLRDFRLSEIQFWDPDHVTLRTWAFNFFGRCPALTKVDLSQARWMNDESIIALAKTSPSLTSLDLCTLHISDNAVSEIAAHCVHLRNLELSDCPYITYISVLQILEKCSLLNKLDVCCSLSLQSLFEGILALPKEERRLSISFGQTPIDYLIRGDEWDVLRILVKRIRERHGSILE